MNSIRIVRKIFYVGLALLAVAGAVLFFMDWQRTGFVITVLSVWELARRLGFDRGYIRAYQDRLSGDMH